MLMLRRACVALVSALILPGGVLPAKVPEAQPEAVGFSAQRLQYMDQFYADKVKRREMAGIVILVARHGLIAHFSAIGYADLAAGQKMETDTIFRLYSMTKPLASTALLILYQEGRFQLQDPIARYLPEFAGLRVLRTPDAALNDTVPLERPPTIQDVLHHTAGFSHGGEKNAVDTEYVRSGLFGLDVSLAQMMEKLAKIPLLEQPGKRFIYSVGPDVQARLVEVLSGMPFDEFLSSRVLGPLRMTDTAFWLPKDRIKRLATVYWLKEGQLTPLDDAHGHPSRGGFLVEPWSVNSYSVNHTRKGGSFGLVATAEDYWRFAQMMLNGGELDGARILNPSVVKYMTRDHLSGMEMPGPNGRPSGVGFGLGFAVMKDPAAAGFMSSEGTFYWAGAADTHFWVDPKEDMVVVAMAQDMGDAPGAETLWPQIRTLVYSALLE